MDPHEAGACPAEEFHSLLCTGAESALLGTQSSVVIGIEREQGGASQDHFPRRNRKVVIDVEGTGDRIHLEIERSQNVSGVLGSSGSLDRDRMFALTKGGAIDRDQSQAGALDTDRERTAHIAMRECEDDREEGSARQQAT